MSGEKTLPATKKKIDDARKKGQVSVSKDIMIVSKLMVVYAVIFWLIPGYRKYFSELIDVIVASGFESNHHFSADVISAAFQVFLLITFPLVAVCAITATLLTWAQIGFLVAPEAAQPSFKKLDFVQNFKNIFSKKSILQLLLSLCKVAIVAWVVFLVFAGMLNDMVYSYRAGMEQLLFILGGVLKKVIFMTLATFIVVALIDWFIERSNFLKNLKMSHSDLKEEQKQLYGNPEIIQHRKREHRNLLNSSLSRIDRSKVVVANPTHISVALDYEPGIHDVPFIVAMGEDTDALEIRKRAKELGIPIIVNVRLARMIYNDCLEDEYIQREHLELAAEVFRAVFQLSAQSQNVSSAIDKGSPSDSTGLS